MSDIKTEIKRPLPPRPKWGWFAWEATVGYIQQEYSPDATLSLLIYPHNEIVMWGATLSWADVQVSINGRLGFALVLSDLWSMVSQQYHLFKTAEAAVRRPELYGDEEWVDEPTLDALTRLVGVTSTVFVEDWSLIIVYRPVEKPTDRLQARLLAMDNTVVRGGRGATLRDACRNLFHNATPDYKQYKRSDY